MSFQLEIAIVSYEPDDQVKEKKMITLTQEVIPFYLTKMNSVAKENDGHLVLNKVSSQQLITVAVTSTISFFPFRQPGLTFTSPESSTT
jgi:prostaglandin-H2 D-isomerase / glutathione transferase